MSTLTGSMEAKRTRTISRVRSTFMVEALLLLMIVMLLLAVTITLFAFASETSTKAQRIQESADIAQNAVEQFVADPAAMPDLQEVGDYVVRCDIDGEKADAGIVFNAHVIVMRADDELCSLRATKYVPDDAPVGASAGGESQEVR